MPPLPRAVSCKATAAVVVLISLFCAARAEEAVKPKSVEEKAFEVIGIEARTNNGKESAEGGMIPQMWQRFYMEGTIDRIPEKIDGGIVAVYTDYESDANGDYTYILGAKVKPGATPLAGMISKQIPGGKFEEFTSEQGALPLVVPKVWRHIYEYFTAQGAPARAYKADYELYDAALDPNNASAKVYVGVK